MNGHFRNRPGYAIVGFGVISYEGNHFNVLSYGAVNTKAGVDFFFTS